MADKMKIRYTYQGVEAWEESERDLKKLIQDDTGVEFWIETRSIPPMGIPPPVTKDCVEKLKGLNGVQTNEIEED
ncbi:succinyl-:3-ketoacid-coenzyme A transferase mitochondrial precursor [Fusarium beomiforme]|uniref:Succinyl-:3-ketoacid-coenzyme A transferase mitochondrial n=1 Tax=Fusarium beomiforme TaxID=44412 RepID=A0A9P5AHD0_9HYPO|nr:succinyl-:3-ketoacid-coenzyme A transferase mitochondrial precursor [Fusarium beomiforme]